MDDNLKLPKKTRLGRGSELLSLAISLGKKELSSRLASSVSNQDSKLQLVQTRIEQAQSLYKHLSQLKGAAMKFGQMLSIEAQDYLAPEVLKILSQLQDKAPPIPFVEIIKILREELGAERLTQINKLEESPLAAASMGQVHRAIYKGEKVVLKIQYKGIREAIDSDMALLKKIVTAAGWLTQKQLSSDLFFDEIARVLKWESDYERESLCLEKYAYNFREDSRFIVPKPFKDFSSSKVLMMDEHSGLKLDEWLARNPGQDERDFYGKCFLDLYVKEFFEFGLVQTDPNFANFLFKPETQQLVVLDLGATRDYSREFITDYQKLLEVLDLASDEEILNHAIVRMKLLDVRESDECKKLFIEMLKVSLFPFRGEQPFVFSDLNYSNQVRESVLKMIKEIRYSAPPHQLIFLHRKLGGIYNLLKRINAHVNLADYWTRILNFSNPVIKG
ncbi:MAG: AarF/ABC1/UbiB kinase family protein [Proteobacteria bacterium]|nr:AarF/ABC1/UbiB kinase family protein [Pseudomonadota bacterium]